MASVENWAIANRQYEYEPTDLEVGKRYWAIYRYNIPGPTSVPTDPPSFSGVFLRLGATPFFPGIPVAFFEVWITPDDTFEAEGRLDTYRFFSRIPPWKVLMRRKSEILRKPRLIGEEYTPGTGGLSIQEELMQKAWDPKRLEKLLNQGYKLNNVSTEFAPVVEGVGAKKKGGACGCSAWKGGYRATRKNREALKKWKQGKPIGFTMRASLKAKGLLPRTSRKNRGKKIVSNKYK